MRTALLRLCFAGATALACIADGPAVDACAICFLKNDSFGTTHPHALRIAVATRTAIDRGVMREATSVDLEGFPTTLARAAELISYASRDAKPMLIDFIIVDESHAFRAEIQRGKAKILSPTDKDVPEPHGRVITTLPTVVGLANRDIQLDHALRDGLVELEIEELAAGVSAPSQKRIPTPAFEKKLGASSETP